MEVIGIESLLVLNDSRSTEVKSQEGFLQLPLLLFTVFIQQYLLQNNIILLSDHHALDFDSSLLQQSISVSKTLYLEHKTMIISVFYEWSIISLQMLSSEFSEGEEDWSSFQQTCQPATFSTSIQQYQNAMSSVDDSLSPNKIDPQVLKHHRITVTHNTHLSNVFGVYEKECYISIKKKLHYGTHIVYDVVLANFLLEIHLLNIHRNSDEKDLTMSESEIGSGGFGSVRRVTAGGDQFAVKRINFVSKAERVNGFDIDTENAEHEQIQKAVRQYSLFKICSMFHIGPKVIFQSYDLVCFNNCMEFAMELCHCPSKNPRFLSERGISMQSLQQDLLENMKILHSLKIVHKDIKPENILFSQSLNKFVFADFGITHAVAEDPTEKSFTNFAGTMEHCSQEMKEIISTGVGYVNLYMNDFVGLSKTIEKFNEQSYLSSSISHNPMSYNQSSGGFIHSQQQLGSINNSIQQWFENECSQSCSNVNQPQKQCSDNIYITSTHSLDAPSQFSSQINYYESLIIYQLIKNHDVEAKHIASLDIIRVIESYAEQINDDYILEETRKYVIATFYPSDKFPLLSLKIVELKNTARNYGPKSQETLRKVQQLLQEKEVREDSQVCQYFTTLRKEIIQEKRSYEKGKFFKELMIHFHIKNYTFVIGCGIRILRESVRALKNASKSKQKPSINLSNLCKIYIICNRLDVLSIVQNHLINELFLQVWDHNKHEQLHQSINEETETHNYSRYGFHQNPVSNRITAKLMRHAILHLIKHETTADEEVILVFQYFLQKYDWTNSEDYKIYYQYLQNVSDKLEGMKGTDEHKRCHLMVELAKIYRKLCRLQNHLQINKGLLLSKVESMVEQLDQSKDRKFYFACAAQLIWMKFENGDNNTTLPLNLLNELKAYQCTTVEKNQLLIQFSQIIGSIFIKTDRFDESFNYLLQTQSYIKSAYGIFNLSNSYYECLNNIAFLYHQTYRYQQALNAYQSLLQLVQRTNNVLTYQKSLLYRAIITIRIQMGVNKDQHPLLSKLIKSMVYETIFALISLTTSDNELRSYVIDASIFNFITLPKHTQLKIFVMKSLLKHIQDHLHYFQIPYDKINYELNKIYVKQLKQPSKGLVFIWNYIKIKILDFHNVTRQDFKLMNDFISNLIKNNSSRRALIILKKYIFHIPITYYEERKAAFRLFNKIHFNIGHPFEAVTSLLIARDCESLYSKNFSRIFKRESTQEGRMTNLLLQKWLARL